jgi:protein-tyrosine phosphatase
LIDLHCHILPGLDDGPGVLAESLEMAELAAADGIRGIVATPHTLNGVYDNPRATVRQALVRFRRALLKKGLALDLYPGTDTHLAVNMMEKIATGAAVTINETGKYILMEFPHHTLPLGAEEALFELSANDITPIITHPERNFVIQSDPEMLYAFVNMGCLVQITAMSIVGGFGGKAMESARIMLELRLAHIIASDAHDAIRRPPVLSPAVKAAADILECQEEAEDMVLGRPKAIIEGRTLQIPEPKRRRKKWWWFR